VSVLGILGLQEQIARFFLFLPRLFVAMFIMFFGLAGSQLLFARCSAGGCQCECALPSRLEPRRSQPHCCFVLSIVFEELGLAEETMLVAFGIAFGALMLGLAIAFGIGGRGLARRFLEKKFVREKKEENEDELSPL